MDTIDSIQELTNAIFNGTIANRSTDSCCPKIPVPTTPFPRQHIAGQYGRLFYLRGPTSEKKKGKRRRKCRIREGEGRV